MSYVFWGIRCILCSSCRFTDESVAPFNYVVHGDLTDESAAPFDYGVQGELLTKILSRLIIWVMESY